MLEQIAAEKAAYKVLNSGIDFSTGTSQADVNKLANEIGNILEGNVDKSKIDQNRCNFSSIFSIIWTKLRNFEYFCL